MRETTDRRRDIGERRVREERKKEEVKGRKEGRKKSR